MTIGYWLHPPPDGKQTLASSPDKTPLPPPPSPLIPPHQHHCLIHAQSPIDSPQQSYSKKNPLRLIIGKASEKWNSYSQPDWMSICVDPAMLWWKLRYRKTKEMGLDWPDTVGGEGGLLLGKPTIHPTHQYYGILKRDSLFQNLDQSFDWLTLSGLLCHHIWGAGLVWGQQQNVNKEPAQSGRCSWCCGERALGKWTVSAWQTWKIIDYSQLQLNFFPWSEHWRGIC